MGTHATVTGSGSAAVGNGSYMGSRYYDTKVTGHSSIAAGQALTAAGNSQAVFGKFNQNKTYDLFEVGYGSFEFPAGKYSEVRKNALSVDSDGNTTADKTIVSGGHMIMNNGLSVTGGISDVKTAITLSIYQIIKYIADRTSK
ncbi:MAG: hypothetical protein NC078_12235 [Ruminococcus sp.]|nr:hypothetical protein [Ruminococcus sp.]